MAAVTDTEHEELVLAEAAWLGRDAANAHKGAEDHSEAETMKLMNDANLWERWEALCAKYSWTTDDVWAGWPVLVDAYCDRMTGES